MKYISVLLAGFLSFPGSVGAHSTKAEQQAALKTAALICGAPDTDISKYIEFSVEKHGTPCIIAGYISLICGFTEESV